MDFVLYAADSVYTLIFIVAAVLAALQSRRDLQVARSLVIAGAIIVAVRWTVWAVTTEAPWPVRGVVGALIGATLFVLIPAALHWLSERQRAANPEAAEAAGIVVNFEPNARYVTNELSHGHILNTVKIGLKATGKPLSNCKLYVEKIAPEPPLPGGFPILLEGGGFILRPDDPEKLFDLVAHWDHVTKFRFNAPGGWWAETMIYIDDGPPRIIEIKFEATELQKTFLFRIWTDESKKLHLERL
jgi:hypothetical protein